MDAKSSFTLSTVLKKNNGVVRDHRVYGIRVMPGVTFIDMVYRILAAKGVDTGKISLKNIVFKKPVSVSDEFDRNITVSFDGFNHTWKVKASSRKICGGEPLENRWEENFNCEVTDSFAEEPGPSIDIEAIKRSAERVEDTDYAYSLIRKMDIRHLPFMKCEGKIYFTKTHVLCGIKLSEEAARASAGYFYLHPALLDCTSVVGSLNYLEEMAASGTMKTGIPMFIKRFFAVSKFEGPLYVYFEKQSSKRNTVSDILTFDINIYDGNGSIAAKFTDWTVKQIRSEEQVKALNIIHSAEKPVPVQAAVAEAVPDKQGSERVDAENFILGMLAPLLQTEAGRIDKGAGFYQLGLDSGDLLAMVGQIEDRVGTQLYPTLLFEYPNTVALAEYLYKNHGAAFLKNASAPRKLTAEKQAQNHTGADKFVMSLLAGLLGEKEERIDRNSGFYQLGLDSGALLGIVEEIEKKAGIQLYPTLLFEYPNAAALTEYLNANFAGAFLSDSVAEAERPEKKRDGNAGKPTLRYFAPAFFPDSAVSGNGISGRDLLIIGNEKLADEFKNKGAGSVSVITPDGEIPDPGKFDIVVFEGADSERVPEMITRITGAFERAQTRDRITLIFLYPISDSALIPGFAASVGFGKCAGAENPKFVFRAVGSDDFTPAGLAEVAASESLVPATGHVRYIGGRRYKEQYTEKISSADEHEVIRNNSLYLITGGAGGAGFQLAQKLIRRGASVMAAGRSPCLSLPPEKQAFIRAHAGSFRYCQTDVADPESLRTLKAAVRDSGLPLAGIFHCAGVTNDSYIAEKTAEGIRKVLRPKTDGIRMLDEAFQDDALDFFVTFSSTAWILGNPGQSDYAYANAYMDYYAEYREKLRQAGKRHGRTLSINWPLISGAGMFAGEQTVSQLKRRFRLGLFDAEQLFDTICTVLSFGCSRIAVLPVLEGCRIDSFLDVFNDDGMPPSEQLLEKPSESACGNRSAEDHDIAIIGISGHYPKADTLDEFWRNLEQGRDCVSPIEDAAFIQYLPKGEANPRGNRRGGFIADCDTFDPLLFNISPRDASRMDPQERKFLETVWECFEDAGYNTEKLNKYKTGVFTGVMWQQYQIYGGGRDCCSTTASSLANRVSYFWRLTGPSISVDTMCSSSLTAIHLACRSIKNGECALAVAGGVNICTHYRKYELLESGNFLSPDGCCKSFGEGANGYVPADGVGAVLLKPLGRAIKDNDRIYAVIKGSAINHNGVSGGFTVPDPAAQTEVIGQALSNAGVDPKTINYIEAHGTGTSLGDPIEISSLTKAFDGCKRGIHTCAIGSVKSNIGHAESAAGMASLTKVLLQMKHKTLVPSVHSEKLNSRIKFNDTPFYVQRESIRWDGAVTGGNRSCPLRAGISAFGAGGSNAHLIVEDYEGDTNEPDSEKRPLPVVFSTVRREDLFRYAERFSAFLKEAGAAHEHRDMSGTVTSVFAKSLHVGAGDIDVTDRIVDLLDDAVIVATLCEMLWKTTGLSVTPRYLLSFETIKDFATALSGLLPNRENGVRDIAYTMWTGREHLPYRLAVIASTADELAGKLERFANDTKSDGIFEGNTYDGTGLALSGKSEMENDMIGWVNGGKTALPAELMKHGHILSLPHYPFSKKKYWLAPAVEEERISGKADTARNPVVTLPEMGRAGNQKTIALEIHNGIALVRMQGKQTRNTFTEDFIRQIESAFDSINKNHTVRAVVVTGYDSVFCMGGTHDQLIDISEGKRTFADAPFLYTGFLNCRVPVISAMQGHAMGGGMLFGLYADIVVMAEESVYSAVFTKYGFTPGMGATYIVEKKFGRNIAMEMLLTAKSYSGGDLRSHGAGIVTVKRDRVLDEAMRIAETVTENPPRIIEKLKQKVSREILSGLLPVIDRELEMHRLTFTKDAVKDKIQKFYR